MRGELKLIQYLTDQKPNLDIQDNEGYTPLHFAAKSRYPKTVKHLIKAGAKIDIKTSNKKTPLEACLFDGYRMGSDIKVKILKELIIRGAKLNFSDINFEREFKNQFDKILNICNDQQKVLVLANTTDALDKNNNPRLKNWCLQLLKQLEEQIDKTIGYIIDNSYDRQEQIEICQESVELKPKIEDTSIIKPFNYYEVINEFFPKRIASDAEIYRIIFDYISTKSEYNNKSQQDEKIKPNIGPLGKEIEEFVKDDAEKRKKLSYGLVPNSYAFNYINKKQQEPGLKIDQDSKATQIDLVFTNDVDDGIIGQINYLTLKNA